MKRFLSLFAIALLTATMWAQSPQKISYQSVVRDTNGDLVQSTQVGMQISILQGAADGIAVYTETQTPTTNVNGLLSVEIGAGTTTDDFSTINWANGPHFVKVGIDPDGGDVYDAIVGVSEMLSVPYALYSQNAEQAIADIQEVLNDNGMGLADFISGRTVASAVDNSTDIRFVAKPGFTATNYSWDYGDGNTLETTDPGNNYTYADAEQGAYNVTLTASNNSLSNTITKYDWVIVAESIIKNESSGKYNGLFEYGDQTWLVGSYITKQDSAGNSIAIMTNQDDWNAAITTKPDTALRCYADFDPSTGVLLYSYGAAKNACPKGYHLPSVTEWLALESHLASTYSTVNPTTAMAARSGWTGASVVDGMPIHDQPNNNISSFTAVPVPVKMNNDSDFMNEGDNRFAFFWTADDNGTDKAKGIFIYYKLANLVKSDYEYGSAFQVRCIKD